MTENKRDIKYSLDNGEPWHKNDEAEDSMLYESSSSAVDSKKAKDIETAGEFLYGKSLKWYKSVLIWPMFILLFIEISIRVLEAKFFILWSDNLFFWLIELVRVIIFIYLSITVLKQYKLEKSQLFTTVILGGAITGFLLAIFQLFWYFKLWTFFSLIGLPLQLAFEGLIISYLIYLINQNK